MDSDELQQRRSRLDDKPVAGEIDQDTYDRLTAELRTLETAHASDSSVKQPRYVNSCNTVGDYVTRPMS